MKTLTAKKLPDVISEACKIYPLTVFLVDGDSAYLELCKRELTNHFNFKVRSFAHGEGCLNALHLYPDIVVVNHDFTTGGKLNGLETLKEIKKIDKAVKVIMLLPVNDLLLANLSLKHGAYDYVVKNANAFIQLSNILTDILKKKVVKMKLKMLQKNKKTVAV